MQTKRIHYGFAALSFLIALVTYTMTMQPTIPFWDCGEFAAAAKTLSIPHPPGAPLWTIVGRIALLIPTFSDPSARYNFFSVLSSAVSILLLYLITVRVIKFWRGEPKSTADIITHYGGAFIAAMAYTWTDSFWFNALESEVYAFGSLFISLVPWLILVWHDHADEEHSEKYLLLIFYVIGLSMGVHQLALLTVFPVVMLVYYKRWPGKTDHSLFGKSFGSWWIMVLVASAIFMLAFGLILSDLVKWMGGPGSFADLLPIIGKPLAGIPIPQYTSIFVMAAMIYGLYWSQKNKRTLWNLGLWAGMLLFLGYSTYAVIMVRAAQDPPMNQWHASTFKVLNQYIDRQQYGEAKEFPRRLPEQKADHAATWDENKYHSDADFFWKYQTGEMYLRYLGWNFIGRKTDDQGAPVDWSKTFGLPFFLGLFGLIWHFRRDPKRAFTFLGMFLIMGFLVDWYQNQQDPQPRERDYFYVGAFYVYAMWMGIGATGIMEFIRVKFGKRLSDQVILQQAGPRDILVRDKPDDQIPVLRGQFPTGVLAGVFGLLILIGPLNLLLGIAGLAQGQTFKQASKWGEYSRFHNYVPFEYAYNILQSCDKDAVLFTAGDNDTFPLWAIQDVFGIRRDVRIVNLSLGNMSWYVDQLKNQDPWGSKRLKLPFFTDDMLKGKDMPSNQEAQSPDPGAYAVYVGDHGLFIELADALNVTADVSGPAMANFTGQPTAQPGKMTWEFHGERQQEGKQYYSVADLLVRDIVVNNINERPIYFASAVPASYQVGLDNYMVSEGLASRVTPIKRDFGRSFPDGPINEPLYRAVAYNLAKTPSTGPQRAMILNSYRDPAANRSILDDHYGAQTYFILYYKLASYYANNNNLAEAKRAIDTLVTRIPPERVDYEPQYLQYVAEVYTRVGDNKSALKYAQIGMQKLNAEIPSGADASTESGDQQGNIIRARYQMADLYLKIGQLDSARKIFSLLMQGLPEGGDKALMQFKVAQIDAQMLEKKGDKKGAYDKYNQMAMQYAMLAQSGFGPDLADVARRRDSLAKQLGIPAMMPAPAVTPPNGIVADTTKKQTPARKDGVKTTK